MSSVLYLLREPVEQISRCLYTEAVGEAMVIRVDQSSPSPEQFAEIVQPGNRPAFPSGQSLTSRELLDLVMDTAKIITL